MKSYIQEGMKVNNKFCQNSTNEWTTVNEEGNIRIVTTNGANASEMTDILLIEDELELLREEKEDLKEKLENFNYFSTKIFKEEHFFGWTAKVSAIIVLAISLFSKCNFENVIAFLVFTLGCTGVVTSLFGFSLTKILNLCSFGTKRKRKITKVEYEEKLARLQVKELKLEEELFKLKKKCQFEVKIKDVINISKIREERIQEKQMDDYSNELEIKNVTRVRKFRAK